MNTVADTTIIVMGGGNMGSSLVKGMLANHWKPEQITICEQDQTRSRWLSNEFPECVIVKTVSAPIPPSCTIILAVKPQDVQAVCQQISVNTDTLIISIAAGVQTQAIQRWLDGKGTMVRCMPNTPAAIGQGITGLYASENISATNKKCAEEILSAAGKILWVAEEHMLDAVTAISGSGPAYLFYFMQCMQESGQALGLSAEDCYTLTLQTMIGAALLAQEQGDDFEQLRANVTSKGGTTEQAINCLADNEFKKIIDKAIHAAAVRASEISKSFNKD